MQTAPVPVQVSPPAAVGQHASPVAPQGLPPDWHEPFMHMPRLVVPLRQVLPLPTQVPLTQQPPPSQALVAQQACPVAPQVVAAPPMPPAAAPPIPPP